MIAPLVTSPDGVLRQTIYYPYDWALKYARGRVLDLEVSSETYPIRAEGLRADFARDDQVPYLDVAVTVDAEKHEACVFVLNRDLDAQRELVLDWRSPTPTKVLAAETLTGRDLKAINTFAEPNKVVPQKLDAPQPAARMTLKLPPASYSVLHLATA